MRVRACMHVYADCQLTVIGGKTPGGIFIGRIHFVLKLSHLCTRTILDVVDVMVYNVQIRFSSLVLQKIGP